MVIRKSTPVKVKVKATPYFQPHIFNEFTSGCAEEKTSF